MYHKEEQFGWAVSVWLLILPFIMLIFYLLEIGDNPMPLYILIIFILLFLILFLLFFKLTVVVDSKNIILSYGIGLIRKKIDLKTIKDVKKIKTNWFNGWGIRKI